MNDHFGVNGYLAHSLKLDSVQLPWEIAGHLNWWTSWKTLRESTRDQTLSQMKSMKEEIKMHGHNSLNKQNISNVSCSN